MAPRHNVEKCIALATSNDDRLGSPKHTAIGIPVLVHAWPCVCGRGTKSRGGNSAQKRGVRGGVGLGL